MKRSVYLLGILFLVGVFSVANVFAVCTNDNQTMFKLYQNTNSHVSSWNTTTYSVLICYNDIFGVNYTGVAPHNCTGTNTLFWTTAENNSHVSNSSANGYSVGVCYGDLSCSVVSGNCLVGFTDIIKFYNYTNSHVSNLSDTSYNYKLCCKNSGISATGFNWTNMNGEVISTAQKGDSVILFFGLDNIGKNVNYSLYEKNGGVWVWLGFVDEYTLAQKNSTNKGYVVWKAISEGEYYFNMSIDNGVSWSQSRNITIANSVNDESPDATITNAVGNNRYSVNYEINFTQGSKDEDDLLKLNWAFGDGGGNETNNYSYFEMDYINPYLGNSKHSYSKPGGYRVVLVASEKITRGMLFSDSDYFDVSIFKPGINVFPVIASPANGVSYNTSWIFFNASQTYVVNCSLGMDRFNFTTIDGNLNCRYIHEPGKNVTDSSYDLIFKWDFDDEVKLSKSLDGNYSNVVVFPYKYSEAKRYVAKLNVTYVQL